MSDDDIIESFLDAVCDGGTPVADCGFCGKTFFAGDGDFMDEGELEKLEAKAAAAPDKYEAVDAGSVSYGHIFGRQVVWHCRCEKVKSNALTIWARRHTLLEFFSNARAKMANATSRLDEAMKGAQP